MIYLEPLYKFEMHNCKNMKLCFYFSLVYSFFYNILILFSSDNLLNIHYLSDSKLSAGIRALKKTKNKNFFLHGVYSLTRGNRQYVSKWVNTERTDRSSMERNKVGWKGRKKIVQVIFQVGKTSVLIRWLLSTDLK